MDAAFRRSRMGLLSPACVFTANQQQTSGGMSRRGPAMTYGVEEWNIPLMPRNIAQNVDNAIPILATSIEPHFARLEAKLKRELGETVLELLAARDTEDIVLNPDS